MRSDLSGSTNYFESLWIEIQSDLHHNLICWVIYRHPRSDLGALMVFLNRVLNEISKEKKYCLIMGDFNLNLINYESYTGTNDFINTIGSYFFHPHILQPTRLTDHSATLIDNIFFNSVVHHTISGNIIYDLTDHLPNFLIINKFSTLPKNSKIFRRDYSNFNESLLSQEIQSINWNEEITNDGNPNSLFDAFYTKLTAIIDKHIPLRQLSKRDINHFSKPWITLGIRISIKQKNNYYNKYIKTKSLYYYNKFKLYRNKINNLIRINKINYYNRYFDLNRSHINNIWKGIKQIITLKSKTRGLPSKLLMDGKEITDSKSIANSFNDFFASIGNTLA